MLNLARAEDWDGLVEQEAVRRTRLAELRTLDAACTLQDDECLAQKREAIEAVLAMDEEIRRLTTAWQGELKGVLSSMSAKKNSTAPMATEGSAA